MPDDRGGRPERERSRSDFVSEAEEILETLSDRMRELERVFAAGRPHTETINTIFREVHSLKGLASLLGFPEIAAMTHELEDLLSRLRLGGALEGPVLDLLHLCLDALLDALRRVRTGGAPATGLDDIRERLRLAVASIVVPAAPLPPGLDLPADLLAVLTEFEERRLADSHRQGRRLSLVRLRFEPDRLEAQLEEAGHKAAETGEVIARIPVAGEAGIAFDFLLASDRPLRPDDFPAELAPIIRSIATGTRSGGVPPGTDASAEEDREDLAGLSGSLRVPVARLDDVLAQVGDLSIAVAALEQGLREVREVHPEDRRVRALAPRVQGILKRLRALQRSTIEVRLVPLQQVFRRAERLVARTARASGREAALHALGADTEIDKGVMDGLAPSLMHLVTNALVHGIETPEDRERAGKPRQGRVVLSAFRRGASVVIDVIDDGRGISVPAVRAAAEARGLLHAKEPITLAQACDLIFLPGFSTETRVNEVSGRGVGMDVVRRSLRRLKGTVAVRSVEGKGTTFTMIVPISLALVPALIVQAQGRRFAIPLGSIRENVRLLGSRRHREHGGDVYDHPDGPLRLVRLERLLEGSVSDSREAPQGRFALVTLAGGRRLGIVVDGFLGRQDVVVKPVGRWVRDVTGVAGATDLGDASAVLVLDPEALVAAVPEERPHA
jgi:two-component system chemotaxis sensor kinase CheA